MQDRVSHELGQDGPESELTMRAVLPRESYFEAEPVDSAEAFLDVLAPRNHRWNDTEEDPQRARGVVSPPGAWLFRGHADARWMLIPKALRPNELKLWDPFPVERNPANISQILAEQALLNRYLEEADDHGLPLLFDTSHGADELRPNGWLNWATSEHSVAWPPERVIPALALLQHHGVPTRLLDWTTRGYTAAYFAAREAAEWCKEEQVIPAGAKAIDVWAISRGAISSTDPSNRLIAEEYEGPPLRVRLARPPRAGNPNLHAQAGWFTYTPVTIRDLNAPISRDSLREVIGGIITELDEDRIDLLQRHYWPMMRRFRLPVEEAPRLLRLLAYEGISASSLYPGHAGIAQALRERRLWDRTRWP